MARAFTPSRVVAWALATVFIVLSGIPLSAEAQRLYRQKIDPDFGPPLNDLNWTGEGLFSISETCFAAVSSDGWYSNGPSGGLCAGGVSLMSTDITLTSISTPSSSTTLSFSANPSTIRVYVDWVSGTEKNILAISGSYLAPLETSVSWAKEAGADAGVFSLAFNGYPNTNFSQLVPDPPKAHALLTYCGRYGTYVGFGGECTTSIDANVTISPVPEPQAYLLGLASFGILGVWARRRRLNTC